MFTEDLSAFLNDFGVEIAFRRGSTSLFSTMTILDAPPIEMAVYDRSFYDEKFYAARTTGAKVQLLAVATEVSTLQVNDIATVNGEDWYVTSLEPDGTGFMTIHISANQV